MANVHSHVANDHQARMHRNLWVMQWLLAIVFGASGLLKLALPVERLVALMTWPGLVPDALVRVNGLAELAGAFGLILPGLMKRSPQLTPLAAYGLVLIMCLAAGFHISHSGFSMLPANILLGALAGWVGWGRNQVPVVER